MSCCGVAHEACNAWGLFSHSTLPAAHGEEVRRLHHVLQSWLLAKAEEQHEEKATADLLALQVAPAYAFSPSPSTPLRAILLSITLCYWTATASILTPTQKEELAFRLKDIPSFEDVVPQFAGTEVERPEELSAKKLEALMKITGYILPGIAEGDVVKMWQELAEVGAGVWGV